VNAAATAFDIFRKHGGKIETARALFPHVRAPWIDLSTGISPWAYPFAPLSSEAFTRLPSPESIAELEAAAAESYGVRDPAHVVAVPGSDLALRVLGHVFAGRRVAVVRPGYSGHVLAWGRPDISLVSPDAIEGAAREHDVVVLANPNNPDGRVVERERLLGIATTLSARGGVLIVDEAFADVSPSHSLSADVRDEATRIVVFRSFGKFFGLAGVRLGFVMTACSEVRRAFRHAVGDWPVSGVAVEIGIAAYRDVMWQEEQRSRVLAAARRLDALLMAGSSDLAPAAPGADGAAAIAVHAPGGSFCGELAAGLAVRVPLEIAGGTALFRLARCSNGDALFRHLLSHGILTRPFSSDTRIVRFGLPGAESQWERLAHALHSRAIS
jgi:cobalamin biosynthesis protein CobC